MDPFPNTGAPARGAGGDDADSDENVVKNDALIRADAATHDAGPGGSSGAGGLPMADDLSKAGDLLRGEDLGGTDGRAMADSRQGGHHDRSVGVVVFSDVVNSTVQMFRDEAAAVQLIQRDLSLFQQQIQRHGGTLIKFTGDGILATFHTTTAAVGFVEAVVTALAQQRPSLQHRFGMHLGEFYRQGEDILGQSVHLAARLQTISPANGLAFTEATQANLDSRYRQRAIRLGAMELKGLSGRVLCYAIEERRLLPAPAAGLPPRSGRFLGSSLLRRLAGSRRSQLIAALVALLLGAISDLDPTNPVSAYLLDRRLVLQKGWRQLTRQPGPTAAPVPVVLLRSSANPIPRTVLADLLQALPPSRFPVLLLDYVLDQVGPDPVAMERLVALIRQQRRSGLVVGYFGANAGAIESGDRSRPIPALLQAGAQVRNLVMGTAAGPGPLQPAPLQILEPLGSEHFAAAIASALRPHLPAAQHGAPAWSPAEAVIDWSVAWERSIRVTQPAALAAGPDQPVVVVGSLSGSQRPDADLFRTPSAFRQREPFWGGTIDEMPGVIAQIVLAQSLALGHWLIPLSSTAVAALASGLGVLAAAAWPSRGARLRLLLLGAPLTALLSLQVAVSPGLLVPIALPTVAFGCTCLLRRDA